jgi:hypothetical protein
MYLYVIVRQWERGAACRANGEEKEDVPGEQAQVIAVDHSLCLITSPYAAHCMGACSEKGS